MEPFDLTESYLNGSIIERDKNLVYIFSDDSGSLELQIFKIFNQISWLNSFCLADILGLPEGFSLHENLGINFES